MAILNKIDLRIMISGHLLDIIVTGIYRSMTLLQPLYVEHFQKGEAPIALFSTFIHIGSMFGGFLCGFLFPKFGLTRPARWAGLIGAAGWCAVSAVLSRKSTILCDCLFFIIGIASGIMEPAYLNSARYNVSPSGMGPVMVIMGGGGATAYLILPKFLNTVIPWLGLKLATASVAVLYCLASIVAFGLLDKPHVSHTKSIESDPDAIEIEQNALGSRTLKKNKNAGKGKLVSRRVLSDASYLLFVISKHLYLIGFGGLSLFLSQLLGSLGFTKATVGNLLLYTGVVEWVARLAHAFWAVNAFDHILSLMTIYTGSGLYYLGICSALLWPQYKWYLTVGFLFFGGCCTSGFGGLMQITLVDITPKQDYTVAFTMQTISSGLGLALGPLYTGLVVDLAASQKSSPVEMGLMQNVTDTGHSGEQTKEFWPAFMTISCFSLLAASLVGALKIVFLRKQRRLAARASVQGSNLVQRARQASLAQPLLQPDRNPQNRDRAVSTPVSVNNLEPYVPDSTLNETDHTATKSQPIGASRCASRAEITTEKVSSPRVLPTHVPATEPGEMSWNSPVFSWGRPPQYGTPANMTSTKL